MSIDYVRRTHQILTSDVLRRDIFVDELPDLDDSDLNRLIAESEVMVASLQEDHESLDAADGNRVHVRHKRNIWKAYKQAAMIEKRMRNIDSNERFFDLVAERIGASEAKALMAQARG